MNVSISAVSRKVCFGLVVCGSILIAPALHAFNRVDVIKALQSVNSNWSDSEVEVWINDFRNDPDPGVLVGDTISFSAQSDEPSYFLFTLVDSKGETTLISGNEAVSKIDFPSSGSDEALEQAAPLGEQNVFVFASESRFDLSDFGISEQEQFATLPSNVESIEKFAAALSEHGGSAKLAAAPRYTYFVDSPDVQLSTRGLRKTIGKQMEEIKPSPDTTPVVVAAKRATAELVTTAGTATADASDASSAMSLDIKFESDSDVLGSLGVDQLDALGSALVSLLEQDSLPRISLEGHTDNTGSYEYNMDLSDKRAKSARLYLVNNFGLPEDSIDAYGMGESSPMVGNTDSAARAQNRRVELRVVR